MNTTSRPLATLMTGGLLLILAACTDSATPAAAPVTPASPPASTVASASAAGLHVAAGTAIAYSNEDGAGTVTVADPKIIKPPADWGDDKVVLATVTWTAQTGTIGYTERDFTLVLPDGQRADALGIASDTGLPGHSLGSGTLTAGKKAKGLIAFDEPLTTLDGATIELRSDEQGRDWKLGA